MSRCFFLALLSAFSLAAGLDRAASAAPVSYKLPEETAAFKPAPISK